MPPIKKCYHARWPSSEPEANAAAQHAGCTMPACMHAATYLCRQKAIVDRVVCQFLLSMLDLLDAVTVGRECRYVSREYVETVHFQSEPFKQLKAGISNLEWVEPMSLKMYEEKDIGF